MLAGQEASMDAESLFQRSSRASCKGCWGGAVLPVSRASVRRFAEFNGEIRGQNDGKEMIHDFAKMIEYVSEDETLQAGEIFGSGTYGGCCGMEIDYFLKDGDVIEIEIEKIGKLRNKIVPARRG
jgi:2-keto-4-pentenoate hydratase/2-oxohepta-3-ene-1,7-dioic acid hydratase in catechol pathway